MLKVVETFSGIGSQAKALENIGIEHEIVCTADWDINAIIGYDLIHNGKQDLEVYNHLTKEELIKSLKKYTLSLNGKKPATEQNIEKLSEEVLRRLLCAINRSKNLVSITDIKARDLPESIDLLTYSFPCQDLSLAGNWHGNNSGIDRNAHNRSGMLWEVERILKERIKEKMGLPKFLLMENVSNILSERHIKNFDEWRGYLEEIGYYNQTYTLDSSKFGTPQKRKRTYMLSVLVGEDSIVKNKVKNYFISHNLEDDNYVKKLKIKRRKLNEILKTNYNNPIYRKEADLCQPNDTPSRREIYQDNAHILENGKISVTTVPTVTTKQDRNPNSGVIEYSNGKSGKSFFRYFTPRECFLLMGFDEEDYNNIINNNFMNKGRSFFNIEKLNRMAGNSIVVNVLEEIFRQVEYINERILVNITKEDDEGAFSLSSLKNKLQDMLKTQTDSYQIIKS